MPRLICRRGRWIVVALRPAGGMCHTAFATTNRLAPSSRSRNSYSATCQNPGQLRSAECSGVWHRAFAAGARGCVESVAQHRFHPDVAWVVNDQPLAGRRCGAGGWMTCTSYPSPSRFWKSPAGGCRQVACSPACAWSPVRCARSNPPPWNRRGRRLPPTPACHK